MSDSTTHLIYKDLLHALSFSSQNSSKIPTLSYDCSDNGSFVKFLKGSNPDWKNYSDQTCSCLRASRLLVSRGPNWGSPKTARTITALSYPGLKGGPKLGPHYAPTISRTANIIFSSLKKKHLELVALFTKNVIFYIRICFTTTLYLISKLNSGSRLTFSYIFFSTPSLSGPPCRIFLLYLSCLPCHFYLVVIEQQ